jgi:pilus assembly protein Flp/PilA
LVLKLNINLEAFDMRKFLNDVKTLAKDEDGVVSFEYIIVAAAIIAVVGVVFGSGGALEDALTSGLAAISTALNAAVNPT